MYRLNHSHLIFRSQSKLSLTPETETAQKISEEMSRLITLANTVLSTKLPDLACTCLDNVDETITSKLPEAAARELLQKPSESNSSLNSIEEDANFMLNPICDLDTFKGATDTFMQATNENINDITIPPSTPKSLLENSFPVGERHENEHNFKQSSSLLIAKPTKTAIDKKNDYNSSNFIEDESGFSSMSSFQEIGIPIISIIPPSPCKEMAYLEDIPDICDAAEKWKTDNMELEKQTMKVFWV